MCICMSEATDDIIIAIMVVVELFQTLIRRGKNPNSAKDFINRVFLAFLGGSWISEDLKLDVPCSVIL